ncbi:MAG: tetratricopeptide repeat protein [Actinobacteria bacterium]|nr:MAG: tetratricopeptide repeat protein [Actinomycetota bacterium]
MLLTDTAAHPTEGARATGPPSRDSAAQPPRRGAWRRGLAATLVVAAVFGLLLGRFIVAGRNDHPVPAPAPPSDRTSAEARVARLQSQLRAQPDSPALLTQLADAYLVRARETADPTYYNKADQAVARSAALAPDDGHTLTTAAFLDLARHNFGRALERATRAHALNPDDPDPLTAIFDAHIELGQYDAAATTVDEMLSTRPALASYARLSYLRELRGDTPGAIGAMTEAVEAGAGSPDDRAYVLVLLGDLHLGRGDLAVAEANYLRAERDHPDYGPAEVGRARVAAARGDLQGAADRLTATANRLPLPATVALLGDVLDAMGRPSDAARQYDLVRAIESLNRANGVSVDFELARFDADHLGDAGANPAATVAQAQAALAARPTIFAEDALAWALRGARQPADALPHATAAVRLGTQQALLWYHLAVIDADLGRTADARAHLTRAFGIDPHISVRDLPAAQALATQLGVAR